MRVSMNIQSSDKKTGEPVDVQEIFDVADPDQYEAMHKQIDTSLLAWDTFTMVQIKE